MEGVPPELLRQLLEASGGMASPSGASEDGDGSDMEGGHQEWLSAGAWQATLAKARKAVVVVRMEIMCDPEGGSGGTSQGTGFVVDARGGLIVTNRHIGE